MPFNFLCGSLHGLHGHVLCLPLSRFQEMPTRTSPHRPISAQQPAQVTGPSSVAWSGTISLLPPHLHLRQLREACLSHWIGSVMALPSSGWVKGHNYSLTVRSSSKYTATKT